MGAYSAGGAEAESEPLVLTLVRPGAGMKVVMTRRLRTLRTRTGRGAGAWPALSWWVSSANITAKSTIEPQSTGAPPGRRRRPPPPAGTLEGLGRSVTPIAPLVLLATATGPAGVRHHRSDGSA